MLLATPFHMLKHLDLAHNAITGINFSGVSLPALETLDLWNNKVGNEGLRAITESQSPSLRTLSLGENTINEEGLKAARWGDRKLDILHLDMNPIQDGGARALANPQYLSTLQVLGLTHAQIGREGLAALQARSSIKMITVTGANISEDEKKLFHDTPHLFLKKGLMLYHHNGPVLTLSEIATAILILNFSASDT